MRKYFVVLLALSLAGCTASSQAKFQSNLRALGTDLGILAADLPSACGNLVAALTAASAFIPVSGATPTATAKQQGNIAAAQVAINKYCGPAATALTNTGTAISAIQSATVNLQQAH